MVPAVKINIAFFEKYLSEGLESYYALISEANELGLEIIGDVKRGDIGHTAEMYAEAHLQNPELAGLEDTLAPLEIVGDVKRGDIGHTAEMYAEAHLQNPELAGLEDTLAPDAITVNGYTGLDGIEPFAKMAEGRVRPGADQQSVGGRHPGCPGCPGPAAV